MKKMRGKLALFFVMAAFVVSMFPQGMMFANNAPEAPCAHVCGTGEVCTGDVATCPHAEHSEGECLLLCAHLCGTADACTGNAATCPHAEHGEGACVKPCAHVCGTEEACTGNAATCLHAEHGEGECTPPPTPCVHLCGTGEACTGDGTTCPHAKHDVGACSQTLLHTVRFFAAREDVAAGTPVATATVADGAALAAAAFPGADALGLEENASIVWRMAADDSLLLPDDTVLAYETATVVDVYAEVSQRVRGPVVRGPLDDSITVSGSCELPIISGRDYIWQYTTPGTSAVSYYLPGCTYTFSPDTVLKPFQLPGNSVEILLSVTANEAGANGLPQEWIGEFYYVPRNSTVNLPGADVFANKLGMVSIQGWTAVKGNTRTDVGFVLSVVTTSVTLQARLGTPPTSTCKVDFKVTPESYGVLTKGDDPQQEFTEISVDVEEGKTFQEVSDFVNPVAVATEEDENNIYRFVGWYVDDRMISEDPRYDFLNKYTQVFDKPVTIEARFVCEEKWKFGDGDERFSLTGFEKYYDGVEESTVLKGPIKTGDIITYHTLSHGTQSYEYGSNDPPYVFTHADVVSESITVTISRPGMELYVIKDIPAIIRPRPVEITVYGNEGYYNGQPLGIEPDANGNLFIATGFLPGERLSDASVSAINTYLGGLNLTNISRAGQNEELTTTFDITNTSLLNLDGNKSIGNYAINLIEGKLILKPRPITYVSASASKVYDGTPLTAESVTVYDGAYTSAAGLTSAARIANSVVGAYDYSDVTFAATAARNTGLINVQGRPLENSFTVGVIRDGSGQIVSNNFEIRIVTGTLVITPRPVTLTAHSGGPFLGDTTHYTVSGFDIEYSTAANPGRGLLAGHALSGVSAEAGNYLPGIYPVVFSDLSQAVVTATGSTQNLAANYVFETIEGTMEITALGGGETPAAATSAARPAAAAPAAPSSTSAGSEAPAPSGGAGGGTGQGGQNTAEGEVVIPDTPDIPLARPETTGAASWSLVNLLVAILSAAFSVLLMVNLLRRNRDGEDGEPKSKRGLVWRMLAVLAGVAAPVVFLVFENLRNPMVIVNRLTAWMILILIVQMVAMLLLKLAGYRQADEEAY